MPLFLRWRRDATAAPGGHSLLSRLLNLHDPIYGRMLEPLHNSAWPPNLHVIDLRLAAKAKVRAAIAGRHEPYAGCHVVIEHPAGSGGHLDASANPVAIALVSA